MAQEHVASLLDGFTLDEKVTELEVVDDLWYFVVGSSGAVIVGSGRG
jgi:YydF family exported signaling peptide